VDAKKRAAAPTAGNHWIRARVNPRVRRHRPWDDARVLRTVLIVDDYAGFRRSARALLEDEGFEVVGEASDGRTALAEAERLSPAVVLLDVQLPDADGFAVADRLTCASNPPVVVLVSTRAASAYRPYLAATSARGFIAKADLSGERLAALLQ
jgi:DNA-binding NarL/FixJ family response regulator